MQQQFGHQLAKAFAWSLRVSSQHCDLAQPAGVSEMPSHEGGVEVSRFQLELLWAVRVLPFQSLPFFAGEGYLRDPALASTTPSLVNLSKHDVLSMKEAWPLALETVLACVKRSPRYWREGLENFAQDVCIELIDVHSPHIAAGALIPNADNVAKCSWPSSR